MNFTDQDYWGKLTTIMQFLALRDQCQHLASNGYSTNFCLQVMPKIEKLIHDRLFPSGDLWEFWIEQTYSEPKEGKNQ